MLTSGKIETLAEFLNLIRKTPFARASKTTPERFDKMVEDSGICRLEDFFNMAQVLGIDDDRIILNLFYNEYVKQRKKRKV